MTSTTSTAAGVLRSAVSPPATISNSLRNSPNGGIADSAKTASRNSGAVHGSASNAAPDPRELLGAELAHEHAGAHERVALRGRVREHVQQHPGQGDRRAEADTDREDAHVLDAGVGQQPLHVVLLEQVSAASSSDADAEDEQHGLREARRRAGPRATW